MSLREEEKEKIWDYFSKWRHYILEDIVKYIKQLNIHKVINSLAK